ncbi:hypothetical protein BRD15_02755 [Halobacteriales archaeon SW_6_65_15]|nr:MAG: hypothetical protein BRD15_02755 [Halobacteriales archaeon SW_6_65_15]
MATELPVRVGNGGSIVISLVLAAVAVFLVVYPALLFFVGAEIHLVTLVYSLIPAVGSAVLVAGWVVQHGHSLRQLWVFAVGFVSIGAVSLLLYRLVVEPYFFGEVYEIHFVFNRFGLGIRIGILGVITILAYVLAQ